MKKSILGLILVSGMCGSVIAAEGPGSWEFNFYVNRTGIDEEVALVEGIEDSGVGFAASADYLGARWMTSLAFEYVEYDDHRQFSQTVVGTGFANDGDVSTADSDADALLFTGGFGPAWYWGDDAPLQTYIQAGYALFITSERSIAACENCASEDIDMDNSLYAKGGVVKSFGPVSLGVHYTQYLTGDGFDNAIGVSIGTGF